METRVGRIDELVLMTWKSLHEQVVLSTPWRIRTSRGFGHHL